MFDPQNTRQRNKYYYTKKGQILQAKITGDNNKFLDTSKVDLWKDFLIKNNLISRSEIPGPDPIVIKQSYTTTDPLSLQDILSKFPDDAVPIKVKIQSSKQYLNAITVNGWEERVFLITGAVNGEFFETPTPNYIDTLDCQALAVPRQATGAHEGMRQVGESKISSIFELIFRSRDDFVGRIDSGKIDFIASSGKLSAYYNLAANGKTSDTGIEQQLDSSGAYQFLHTWQRSDYSNFSELDPETVFFGSFIGKLNTNNGTTTFEEPDTTQNISYDIYYVLQQ